MRPFQEEQARNNFMSAMQQSIDIVVHCDNYYNEEIRSRQCWHVTSKLNPDEASKRILTNPSLVDDIGPLCKACSLVYVLDHIKDRCCRESRNKEAAMELLAEPFSPNYLLSKFFYHRTELWKWSIYDILSLLKTHKLVRVKTYEYQKSLSHWLLCLLKHLFFVQDSHYSFLISHSDLISDLCCFISAEMDVDLGGSAGYYALCILCHFVTFCHNLCAKGISLETKQLKAFKNVKALKRNLESHSDSTCHGYAFALHRYRQVTNILNYSSKSLWRKRRKKQQCQREKCTKSRGRNKKWKMCSSCMVTAYCSRKCAKMDWKYGHHKLYCKQYAKLRMNSSQSLPKDFHDPPLYGFHQFMMNGFRYACFNLNLNQFC